MISRQARYLLSRGVSDYLGRLTKTTPGIEAVAVGDLPLQRAQPSAEYCVFSS